MEHKTETKVKIKLELDSVDALLFCNAIVRFVDDSEFSTTGFHDLKQECMSLKLELEDMMGTK